MYKVIFFDQDDTLCPAKNKIDGEMATLLENLLEFYKVVIITGGMFSNIEYQVISELNSTAKLENLILFPTCAARMFEWYNGTWEQKYALTLSKKEVDTIQSILYKAINDLGFRPESSWGEIVENRETQVTYSALGQKAPLEAKKSWDPDKKKRLEIIEYIKRDLGEFSLGIGGTTSIDVIPKGVDKSYGVKKMMELYDLQKEDILYVGDALFPGGNDYVVVDTGIHTKKVDTPEDTKKIIQNLL